LSWLTILRKRPAFRLAFANFEPKRVAKYSARDVNRLMKYEGIVRHRGKIEATINNAHATLELQQELGSLAKFVWSFCPENSTHTKRRAPKKNTDIAVSTPESEALSKALRGRGFAFVGPTTMHALMQSVGLVNDHFEGCWVRDECEKKRVITLKKMLA
jgi:DNA-3-methyladenine glycosylase I